MALIIVRPTELDKWLSKQNTTQEISEAIGQTLVAIQVAFQPDNTSQNISEKLDAFGFIKKQFEKKIVYTVNVDAGEGAHRLVFEKLSASENTLLVLRAVALHHDYAKALRWQSFQNRSDLTVNELLVEGFTTVIDTQMAFDEETPKACEPIIQYGEEYLPLSSVQTDILAKNQFPQLIVGPPGSGKTLLIHALFQEQVLQWRPVEGEQRQTLRLLYLTSSEALASSLNDIWQSWLNEAFSKDNQPSAKVDFQTIHAFYKTFHDQQAQEGDALIGRSDYLAGIDKLNKQMGARISSERILEEIIHSAYALNNDHAHEYAQSHYAKLGVNEITISKDDKPYVFAIYQSMQKKLTRENAQFTEILAIKNIADEDKYDLVCVDEAQSSSLQHLLNALQLAKENKVLFCGDSYQRELVRVPSLQLLERNLKKLNIELERDFLSFTHRLQPRVAKLCSDLILLENQLRGGLVDDTAYASLDRIEITENDASLCWISHCDDSYQRLSAKASFCALVLHERDINDAKTLTGSNTVILPKAAKGLQYNETFVYVSRATQKEFLNISTKMKEQEIDPLFTLEKKSHPSPNKEAANKQEFAVLSNFYIALSRSLGTVHIYFEGAEQITNNPASRSGLKPFLQWMKYQCHEQMAVEVNHSTPQEWLGSINKLIAIGEDVTTDIAHKHLQENFELSETQSRDYVNFYHACQVRPNIDECSAWIDLLKMPMAQAKDVAYEAGGEEETKPSHSFANIADDKTSEQYKETLARKPKITPSANVRKRTAGAKKTVAVYLASIWQSSGYSLQENLKLLLNDSRNYALMFSLKMDNGRCLFDNYITDPDKLRKFICVILEIKNEMVLSQQPVEAKKSKPGKKKKKSKPLTKRQSAQQTDIASNEIMPFQVFIDGLIKYIKSHRETGSILSYFHRLTLGDMLLKSKAGYCEGIISFILTLWEELKKDLYPDDLVILGSQSLFMEQAFEWDQYKLLATDEMKSILNVRDLASVLHTPKEHPNEQIRSFKYGHFIDTTAGVDFFNFWFDDLSHLLDCEAYYLWVNYLLRDRLHISEPVKTLKINLAKMATKQLFIQLKEGSDIQSTQESLFMLQREEEVSQLIYSMPSYMETISNQVLSDNLTISTQASDILFKALKYAPNEGEQIIKKMIKLFIFSINNWHYDPKIKENKVYALVYLVYQKRQLSYTDDMGLMALLLPHLKLVFTQCSNYDKKKIDRVKSLNKAILSIFMTLLENEHNALLYIQQKYPQQIIKYMLSEDKDIYTQAGLIVLACLKMQGIDKDIEECEHIIWKLSYRLLDKIPLISETALELINRLVKKKTVIESLVNYRYLAMQNAVFICYAQSNQPKIEGLALDVIDNLNNIGFKPVLVIDDVLIKLSQQYLEASGDEKARLCKILQFARLVLDNATRLDAIFLDKNIAPLALQEPAQTSSAHVAFSIFSTASTTSDTSDVSSLEAAVTETRNGL